MTIAELARRKVHDNTFVDELLKKVSGFRKTPAQYEKPIGFMDEAKLYKDHLEKGKGGSLAKLASPRVKNNGGAVSYKKYEKQVPVIGGADILQKVVMVKDMTPDQHVVNARKGDRRKLKAVDFHPELIKLEGEEMKRRADVQKGIVAGSKSKTNLKPFTGGNIGKLTASQVQLLKKATK